MKHDQIVIISQRSGLSQTACKELLEKGWVWVESMYHPSRWEAPAFSLRNTNA